MIAVQSSPDRTTLVMDTKTTGEVVRVLLRDKHTRQIAEAIKASQRKGS